MTRMPSESELQQARTLYDDIKVSLAKMTAMVEFFSAPISTDVIKGFTQTLDDGIADLDRGDATNLQQSMDVLEVFRDELGKLWTIKMADIAASADDASELAGLHKFAASMTIMKDVRLVDGMLLIISVLTDRNR